MFLASLHNVMGGVWLSAVVVAVSRGRRFIERPGVRVWLVRATGAALVAMGVRLPLEKR